MTKTLIVTGGSQGIGEKTLEYFVKHGWQAINLSRTLCSVTGVDNIAIDLLAPTWTTVIEKKLLPMLSASSQLCLVHNAAMLYCDRVGAIDPHQFQQTLMLNVVAPSTLNNLLIPHMAPDSSIIYIGSTLSEKAVPGCASYVTSKHAILGLMRATCQDLAEQAIHTCCVCPGLTDTPMLRERCGHDVEKLQMLKQISTAQRFVQPTEIAEVIWFAAHHPVLNGAVLHANLGQKQT